MMFGQQVRLQFKEIESSCPAVSRQAEQLSCEIRHQLSSGYLPLLLSGLESHHLSVQDTVWTKELLL